MRLFCDVVKDGITMRRSSAVRRLYQSGMTLMSVLARRLGVVTLAPMIAILCACSAGSGTVTIGNGTDPTLVSNIATLIGVTLSDGDDTRRQTANPTVTAWNSSVTEWTYDVSSTVSTITVTPAPSDNTAQVRVISGDVNALLPAGVTSPEISLAPTAPTIITLAVIAANGTTKTYTLTVNHLAVSDSTLNRLQLSGAVLSPAFNPNTTAYATTVPFAVSTLTVKPTPRDGAEMSERVDAADGARIAQLIGEELAARAFGGDMTDGHV